MSGANIHQAHNDSAPYKKHRQPTKAENFHETVSEPESSAAGSSAAVDGRHQGQDSL